MRRLILLALALAAAAVLVPTVAVADSATHAYVLEMGEPTSEWQQTASKLRSPVTGRRSHSAIW